jgi:hypothetical protein
LFFEEPSMVPLLMFFGGLIGASVGAAKWLGEDGESVASENASPGCVLYIIGVLAAGLVLIAMGRPWYSPYVPIVGLLVTGTASRTGLTPLLLVGLEMWLSLVYLAGHPKSFSVPGWLVQCGILLTLFVVASLFRRWVKWDFQPARRPGPKGLFAVPDPDPE